MKKVFVFVALSFFSSFNAFADAEKCNPTAKYYCACEDLTHGAFWQISFMKLDFSTGHRTVVTALKPYNEQPVYRITHTDDDSKTYSDCVALMRTFPECQ